MKILSMLCLSAVVCSSVPGSVLANAPTSQQQATLVEAKIPDPESTEVKRANVMINEAKNTVYLPVKPGSNLSKLDPKFKVANGYKILPDGPQDFSNGAVIYSINKDGHLPP